MVGQKIRELRIARGLTQEQLASLSGYNSKAGICKIEKGERDIPQRRLVDIAKALGVSPSELFVDTEIIDLTDFSEEQRARVVKYAMLVKEGLI